MKITTSHFSSWGEVKWFHKTFGKKADITEFIKKCPNACGGLAMLNNMRRVAEAENEPEAVKLLTSEIKRHDREWREASIKHFGHDRFVKRQ